MAMINSNSMRIKTLLFVAFSILACMPVLADYQYIDDNGIEWRYELVDPSDVSQGVTMTTTVTSENIEVLSQNQSIPGSIRLNDIFVPVIETGLTFDATVTSIPDYAFGSCESLTSVTISSTVSSLGNMLFFNCPNLKTIVIDPDNPKYTSRGKINATDENETECNAIIEKGTDPNTNTATNTLLRGCSTTVIPDGVTRIVQRAFLHCSNGMTSLIIPASVTNIENEAFLGCDNVTSIVVDANNKVYTSRGTVNSVANSECNAIIKIETII